MAAQLAARLHAQQASQLMAHLQIGVAFEILELASCPSDASTYLASSTAGGSVS